MAMVYENQEYPKISIITVVFNGAKTLEQTILSVVNQTYENIEYIIIDGGSTDGTLDLIRKYEDRIAYWVSEPDNGIYDAMNKGIMNSTGDYLYFLGCDDCLADIRIFTHVSRYLGEYDVVSGNVWLVDGKFGLQMIYSNDFTQEDVFNGYCIPHQGIFVKRKIIKSLLFDLSYKIVSDYDLFLKLYFDPLVKFKYINNIVAFFSLDGVSSSLIRMRTLEVIEVMKKHGLDLAYINKYKREHGLLFEYSRYVRLYIKRFFSSMGVLEKIQSRRGWIKHTCHMENCRWCNKSKGI